MVDLTKLNTGDVILLRNGIEVNVEMAGYNEDRIFPFIVMGYTNSGQEFVEEYQQNGYFSLSENSKDIVEITKKSCLLDYCLKIEDDSFGAF